MAGPLPWTYTGDPSSSPKDEVRFLIGDTNPKDPLLYDGEINYLLAQFNNTALNASIRACEAVLAKFARMADERVGNVDVKFSQKMKQYTQTRDELRRRLAMTNAAPSCPSISVSQKQTNNANSDLVRPDFTKHMMENTQDSNVLPQQANAGSNELDGSND